MIADESVSPSVVVGLGAHLADALGARVETHPGWVRAYLGAMGDPDSWALTVGRTVYMPHPLGRPGAGWTCWEQISVLCHEMQHVAQGDRGGSLIARAWDYVTSSARRTETECHAFATQLELEWWRRGEVASWWPRVRAASLRSYHVTEADLLVAERHLRALAPTVRRSGYVTHAGRVAIQWLDRHAPQLRHPSVPSRSS